MINKATTTDQSSAMVLVKARGLNNLPSAPIMVKIGIKLIIVVNTAVRIAPDTSLVALKTVSLMPVSSAFCSRCLRMFSVSTTPISTIVPMAMAIPESATILASTPNNFILINTSSTATGNKLEIKSEALMLNTMTTTTKMVIRISRVRASCSVARVSLMSSLRS